MSISNKHLNNLDLDSLKIINLGEPTEEKDAVNKLYVDSKMVECDIIAGNGLSKTDNVLDVNVDDVTLRIEEDILKVRNNGITKSKINANVAGDGVSKNSDTGALDVNVDNVTLEVTEGLLGIKDGSVSYEQLDETMINDDLITGGNNGAIASSQSVIDLINYTTFTKNITGDGETTEFVINHQKDTKSLICQVWDAADNVVVNVNIKAVDNNNLRIAFGKAPLADVEYRIVVKI